jgi:hypothetical protein
VPAFGLPLLFSPDSSEPNSTDPTSRVAETAAASTAVTVGIPIVTAPPANSPSATGSAPAALLVYEAEGSDVELQRARVEAVGGASGGQAVRFTGTPSRVRFRSVGPAGTYRVTIYYAPPGADATGSVEGADGAVPITFAAGTGCCAALTRQLAIAQNGMITIRLTNGSGPYPAIDRITLQAA